MLAKSNLLLEWATSSLFLSYICVSVYLFSYMHVFLSNEFCQWNRSHHMEVKCQKGSGEKRTISNVSLFGFACIEY